MVPSVIALCLLGFVALAIGETLIPSLIAVGDYVANSSHNPLTGAGGAVLAVLSPCLPYALLGFTAAIIGFFAVSCGQG